MTRIPSTGRIGATPLILLAAAAVAIGFLVGSRYFAAPSAPLLKTAVMYPVARAVPEFTLTRADGSTLTQADWRGRWTIVFFGFTHCPDICPNTLGVLKQVWASLDEQVRSGRIHFDFISVDPQRDTPEQLQRYVDFFSTDFGAATGTDEELTKLTRGLGLVYARIEHAGGEPTVDHSASLVIIDPAGRLVGLFRPPYAAEPLATDLAALADAR